MYEQFFGLRERPFNLVSDPRYLCLPAGHREAIANLRLGLSEPRGLTLVTGEAGTGKTTLIHTVLSEADSTSLSWVLISNPTLTRDEFYETLTKGFGLDPAVSRSKASFLSSLADHLENQRARGMVTALILDEAQSLSHELLEEVRLLGNIDTPTSKLLNIVLAGQPELAHRLNNAELRQLKQRISLRCELRPFDLSEVARYIVSRIVTAGGSPVEIFTREAVQAIYTGSGGIPRTVNVICDNALIAGFAAGKKPVGGLIVEEVCADFDLLRRDTVADSARAVTVGSPSEQVSSGRPSSV